MARLCWRMSPLASVGVLALAANVLGLSACAARQVAIEEIYSSQHCRVEQQTLRVLEGPADLAAVRAPQLDLDGKKSNSALPNFQEQQVMVVALGTKPTAGFRLSLDDSQAQVEGDHLVLPVSVQAPDPDMMQAQVLTSPCLVVAFPARGVSSVAVPSMSEELYLQD